MKKSQSVIEYLLLIAGVLVLIVLVTILIRGSIFAPATQEIESSAATIKGFASALATSP
ncbi:MAG: hypothetical protein V1717_01610 [Candidatus Micrarchaeota archaeon]